MPENRSSVDKSATKTSLEASVKLETGWIEVKYIFLYTATT